MGFVSEFVDDNKEIYKLHGLHGLLKVYFKFFLYFLFFPILSIVLWLYGHFIFSFIFMIFSFFTVGIGIGGMRFVLEVYDSTTRVRDWLFGVFRKDKN